MILFSMYFKDCDVFLISGLPLPKDSDGVVRHQTFVHCTFHPNCKEVRFEGCRWLDCDGVELKNSEGTGPLAELAKFGARCAIDAHGIDLVPHASLVWDFLVEQMAPEDPEVEGWVNAVCIARCDDPQCFGDCHPVRQTLNYPMPEHFEEMYDEWIEKKREETSD